MTKIYLLKLKVVDIALWFYMGMKRSEVCLDLTFNKGSISKLTSQKGLWNLNIHVNKTIIPPLTLNKSRTCKVSHYIRFFSQMNKNIILFNSIIPCLGPMRWKCPAKYKIKRFRQRWNLLFKVRGYFSWTHAAWINKILFGFFQWHR